MDDSLILPFGTRIGPYEIVSKLEIGGGMSTMYKARVFDSEHYIALKLVPASCPDNYGHEKWKRRVDAIEREANICCAIGAHPNVVRYHGQGKTDDWTYLGFDFIEGDDLETLIEEHSDSVQDVIPVKRAVEITKKIAAGLQHIHRKGFVHKDIKAGNILLGKTVKIVDFGLAYDMNNDDNNLKCDPNVFLGTVEYAPPEYLQDVKPHPRGDVYSLGATFFHMLTGQTPFQNLDYPELIIGFSQDLIDFRILGPRFDSLAPHVPEEVQQICLKSLEKSPCKRYKSARQFAIALADILKKL